MVLTMLPMVAILIAFMIRVSTANCIDYEYIDFTDIIASQSAAASRITSEPEPILPEEEFDEPQLPNELPLYIVLNDTEPELPPEPDTQETQETQETSKYPVRDDIVDGERLLAYEYQIAIQEACEKLGNVDYALALAVCDVESDFDPDAASSTSDFGLYQINECNRKDLAKKGYDIDKPLDNIAAGLEMLSEHLTSTKGDVAKALMRYNNGPGKAAKLWKKGIYETDYTKKVLRAYDHWKGVLNA